MTINPTEEQILDLVHRWRHLAAISGQGLPASVLVPECWGVPLREAPEWAGEAAARGDHPSTWCPVVNPGLAEKPVILPVSSPPAD